MPPRRTGRLDREAVGQLKRITGKVVELDGLQPGGEQQVPVPFAIGVIQAGLGRRAQ